MPPERDEYQGRQFDKPKADLKYRPRYQQDGPELQYLAQNCPDVLYTELLDLTVAQNTGAPKVIEVPGRSVVIYGVNSTTPTNVADFSLAQNGGNDPVSAAAFVLARINNNTPNCSYGLKHNRGFRGDFLRLFLSWPVQANTKARLYVFKFDAQPWVNGEAAT